MPVLHLAAVHWCSSHCQLALVKSPAHVQQKAVPESFTLEADGLADGLPGSRPVAQAVVGVPAGWSQPFEINSPDRWAALGSAVGLESVPPEPCWQAFPSRKGFPSTLANFVLKASGLLCSQSIFWRLTVGLSLTNGTT